MSFPWISALTLTPLVGGLMVFGLRAANRELAKRLALAAALVALGLALGLFAQFDSGCGVLQTKTIERCAWIPTLGVEYFVGVDGLGLIMVLLTALLVPMAMFASWRQADRAEFSFGLMLLLQAGLFGTFTAQNFFHWFIFWELSLIPAFFLIKLWGGPARGPAATQFFVYTMVGSVAMLLAFLAIWFATSTPTSPGVFDFARLSEMARNGDLQRRLVEAYPRLGDNVVTILFLGVFLGFAVKVPVIPFHTWLPAAYSEAPSSTTMLLTGAMSKMGVYGFLRILLPIFPEQTRAMLTPLLWLAVATIVFSACAAFAQRDLKRMLAYSSINHLGYCLLGMFAALQATGADAVLANEKAAALDGVMLQMFNHGITAATLFCFVAFLESRSGGLRGLNDFGGLRKIAPVFAGLMGISIFASLGLPGLNGFVSEFLIFKGAFPLAPWATALATIGLLVTAIFLLTIIQRVFAGPVNEKWAKLPDLTTNERLIVLPATVLMFAIGLYPQFILGLINSTVVQMVQRLNF
jgi:NADH-quinone oxidoreductase subunit M